MLKKERRARVLGWYSVVYKLGSLVGQAVLKKKRGRKRKEIKKKKIEEEKDTEKFKKSKIAKREKEKKKSGFSNMEAKKLKNPKDRWSAKRYMLAEENILKIMKAKGAVFGNPILRPELRQEAQKLIGDTRLVDHLLKQMEGKVAPGGAERLQRRHNEEGAIEYWLENAALVDVRIRDAGVQDPIWTPPSGWKPGDSPTQDLICAMELKPLGEEMAKMKRDMEELVSKKQEETRAIVRTPNFSVTNQNMGHCSSLFSLKETYKELVKRKSKIEEQLMEISQSLSGMEVANYLFSPSVSAR